MATGQAEEHENWPNGFLQLQDDFNVLKGLTGKVALSTPNLETLLEQIQQERNAILAVSADRLIHTRTVLEVSEGEGKTSWEQLQGAAAQISDLNRLFFHKDGLATKLRVTFDRRSKEESEEIELKLIIARLKRAERIEVLMRQSREYFAKKAFVEAAKALATAYYASVRGTDKWPDLVIYRNLRAHVTKERESKSAALLALCDNHVISSPSRIKISSNADGTMLADLLDALVELNVSLAPIVNQLLINIFDGSVDVSFRKHDGAMTLCLDLLPSSTPNVISNLKAVAENVASLLSEKSRIAIGEPLVSKYLQEYGERIIIQSIPSDPGELQDLQQKMSLPRELLAGFKSLGLIRETFCPPPLLDLRSEYFEKKSSTELSYARMILLSKTPDEVTVPRRCADHSIVVEAIRSVKQGQLPAVQTSVKDPFLSRSDAFSIPDCLLSKKVGQLLERLEKLVVEMLSLPKDYVPKQVSLIALILELYHFLSTDQMSQVVPRMAIVAHNDAMYMADWVLKLTITNPDSRPLAPFVPLFLQQAKDILNNQIVIQKGILFETLRPLEMWLENVSANKANVERLFLQVSALLKQLSRVAQPALPRSLYQYFVGILYDMCLTHVLNELFSWQDITAQESEDLCSLMQGLLVPAHLFDVSEESSIEWVPHYRVFYDTVEMLNLSFRDIMARFRNGRYHHFTYGQLSHLIAALFQDSDLRRSNLAEINSGIQSNLVQS